MLYAFKTPGSHGSCMLIEEYPVKTPSRHSGA